MDWLADQFEQHRGHLHAVAYRMLGSLPEAEDAVQEAWVRCSRAGAAGIENMGGWLTTIVARICLNMLRARAARPEEASGVHIPDVIVIPADTPGPEQEALLADSVGLALLVVLDTLAPAERLVFVLHDIFEVPFDEIAPMVGRTEVAARQLATRARRRIRESGASASAADLPGQRAVVDAFFAAARAGDFDGLVRLLHPGAVLRSDGGSPRRSRVITGAEAVARSALGGARIAGAQVHPVLVNGAPGAYFTVAGQPISLLAFTVTGGRITAIDGITDARRVGELIGDR